MGLNQVRVGAHRAGPGTTGEEHGWGVVERPAGGSGPSVAHGWEEDVL